MDLGDLIRLASTATESAAEARKQALPATITACRLIEQAVQEMLAGEPLRGLKNLGISGETFYGARIRTKPDVKIDHFNDCATYERFLCLDASGNLVNLSWDEAERNGERWYELVSRPAPDDTLRIGDVDGLLRALRVVIPRHAKASNRTAASYEAAKDLASRIEAALASSEE